MTKSYIYYGLAALMGVLVPLVPRMLQLRILVLRKLHLNWFAEFHERHMQGLIWFIRAILVALALLLIWLASQGSAVGS
jgi:hypothetical protein